METFLIDNPIPLIYNLITYAYPFNIPFEPRSSSIIYKDFGKSSA